MTKKFKSYFYGLWNHIYTRHNVLLLESELADIVEIVRYKLKMTTNETVYVLIAKGGAYDDHWVDIEGIFTTLKKAKNARRKRTPLNYSGATEYECKIYPTPLNELKEHRIEDLITKYNH